MKFGFTRTMVVGGLCVLLCVVAAYAQTASTGALTVTVTDSSGAVIPQASVTIAGAGREPRTLTTDASGSCTFTLLPVGSYEVKISAAGFKTVTVPSAVVNVAETHVLTQALEVGTQSQQVTVNATVESVQTESSGLGGVVNRESIAETPLATRNFTQILNLSSGVNTNVNDASQLGRGNQNTFVNGTGDVSSNYQMDGLSITGFMTGGVTDNFGGLWGSPPIPSPDALQEFKVQTSDYDAGYGHSGGANVNIVTKSGTDTIHGSLFEFNRNDDFNANGFFQNLRGLPRGKLKQNQFGGTIGGPIIKHKLFTFFSYQGTRQINGVAAQGFQTISLPEQLTNDRSAATLGAEFCPANNPAGSPGYNYSHAFLYSAANPLDSVNCDGSNINPVALALLNAKLANGQYVIPSPQAILNAGTASAVGTAAFSIPATFREDQGILNFDYVISPKETLSEKTFYDQGLQYNTFQGAQPPGGAGTNLTGNELSTTKLTSILSDNLVNEAHFSYMGLREDLRGQFPLTTTDFGVTPSAPYWTVFPQVTITSLFGFGGAYTDTGDNPQASFDWGDQLSWNHGRHTMRFGYSETYSELNLRIIGRTRGDLTFNTWEDFLLGLNAAQNGTTQSNLFSEIAVIQAPGGTKANIRQNYISSFFQDDFKMSPRLTWNLGVRWEYNGIPYDTNPANDEINASWAQFLTDPIPSAEGTYVGYTAGTAIGTPLPPGIPQRSSRLYTAGHAPLTNFAPRIGFAWQPFTGNGKLVVRGSFGMFYVGPTAGFISNPAASNEPNALTVSRTGTSNSAASWSSPYNPPSTLGFVARFPNSVINAGSELDPNLRASTMFSEALNVQYAIKPSLVFELGYVGNRVEHIIVLGVPENVPQLALPGEPVNCSYPSGCITTNGSGGATGPSARTIVQGLVPYGLSDYSSVGDSEYSSLQATLRKTFSHGLQFQASYTYGRTFTDVRGSDWVAGSSFNSNDPNDHAQLHGPADFDRPQRLVVSYLYQLPNFFGNQGFRGKALSGWGVSGVTVAQSGQSFAVTDSTGGLAYGSSASRAQACPGITKNQIYTSGGLESRLNGYFLKSAFCPVPLVVNATPGDTRATGFGNTPPGFAVGPGQFNWDLSIIKRTVVGGINENASLEFRAEFFNAFNHADFGNPVANHASGAFGVISSTTVGPRIIQFGLKYLF